MIEGNCNPDYPTIKDCGWFCIPEPNKVCPPIPNEWTNNDKIITVQSIPEATFADLIYLNEPLIWEEVKKENGLFNMTIMKDQRLKITNIKINNYNDLRFFSARADYVKKIEFVDTYDTDLISIFKPNKDTKIITNDLSLFINVEEIKFGNSFNKILSYNNINPFENLTKLIKIEFGNSFNESLEPLKKLSNLKTIILPHNYSNKIDESLISKIVRK
jgi:hypothetical protein